MYYCKHKYVYAAVFIFLLSYTEPDAGLLKAHTWTCS